MTKRRKTIFWLFFTSLTFVFFYWLFGIAIPEIALEFALGTTIVLMSGLFSGRTLTLLALRKNAIRNPGTTIITMIGFLLGGFTFIAFLLNSMIAETELFPFALTVLLLFLEAAAAASLITIVRYQYKSKVHSAQVAMTQSKSELQLLQSQLSPHFLFNTLNNLYGLSLTEPGRVPPLLLKLSDLLRYSVYDVKDIFVPLSYEVSYIKNYVEFERLRLGERLKLTIDLDNAIDSECKIPPLMLIVFVENAFKHSRTTGEEIINIDISLHRKENQIVFSISNSRAVKPMTGQHGEKRSGFGLDSVRRRLELLYAGRHALQIDNNEDRYSVQLELECT